MTLNAGMNKYQDYSRRLGGWEVIITGVVMMRCSGSAKFDCINIFKVNWIASTIR